MGMSFVHWFDDFFFFPYRTLLTALVAYTCSAVRASALTISDNPNNCALDVVRIIG